ncbi:MAG: hypothetical protein ACE37F_02305 [Nannocystaceae bacterium]
MAEVRLGPDELDRLEDALEGLEHLDDPEDSSPGVSARLADFKLILEASREALPLEEVPSGLLDGVLAEARMSAKDTVAPSAATASEGFWARMRRSWLVPGLAVAGSAALVLILLQPTLSDDSEQAREGSIAVQDASSPAAAAPAQSPEPEPELAPALAEEEPAEEEEAPAPPPSAASQAAGGVVAPRPAEASKEAPALAAPDEDGERDVDGWNAVEEGDTSRKGGDCFSARNHYARALDDGNDSVRARAYVGMGLCKREEGNEAAATEYFAKARELDEDALEFGETQNKSRSRKPRPRAPSKKASGKRKKSMNLDEVSDPLSGL